MNNIEAGLMVIGGVTSVLLIFYIIFKTLDWLNDVDHAISRSSDIYGIQAEISTIKSILANKQDKKSNKGAKK